MNSKKEQNKIIELQEVIIPEETSKRITALRFLLIVFVVFLHVLTEEATANENKNLWIYIRTSFLEICNTAVPLFFLFASYIQFRKNDKYSLLLKKRSRSLLVPYIIWTVICMLFYFCVQSFTQFNNLFREIDIIRNWHLTNYFKAFFYHRAEGLKQPLLGQYWFIRELMILIIISPILKLIYDKSKGFLMLFSTIVIFGNMPTYILVDSRSLFFYILGIYFAKSEKVSFFDIADYFKSYEYLFIFIAIQIFKCFNLYLGSLELLFNCLLILKISKYLIQKEKVYNTLKYLSGFSFFLYSVHWPFIINPLKAIVPRIISNNPLQFFTIGIICIFIGTGIGIFIKKIFPFLFALLNGGRK